MKKILAVFFCLLSVSSLYAQIKTTSEIIYTGRLSEDSKLALANYENNSVQGNIGTEGKKSVLLAGAMSALIPGAGEIYTKNYIKAAAFLAIEAAAIYLTIHYSKKGDEATKEFKDYAAEHWSPVRYAEWLNKYAASALGANNPPQIPINYDSNLEPWQQVDFDKIRAVEDLVPKFSHRLENFGEQQYYEVIGKYKQFMHGWDSSTDTPEWLFELPQQVQFSDMFIKPDETFYKYSSRAITVIMLNHLLSALDAVWSAHRYNKNISVGMSINQTKYLGMIDYYPQLNLEYRF